MGNCTRVRSTLGQWFPYLVKMNTVLSAPQMLAFVAVERRILQTPKVLEAVEQLFIGSKSIQTIMRELYSKNPIENQTEAPLPIIATFLPSKLPRESALSGHSAVCHEFP